jgi:hypothetical protein
MRAEPAPSCADAFAARFASADNAETSHFPVPRSRTSHNKALPVTIGSAVRLRRQHIPLEFTKIALPGVAARLELYRRIVRAAMLVMGNARRDVLVDRESSCCLSETSRSGFSSATGSHYPHAHRTQNDRHHCFHTKSPHALNRHNANSTMD